MSSAATGDVAYPDGNVTSWTTYYYAHTGLLLHLRGRFPYARYMSFSVQPVSLSDGGTPTFQRTIDLLYDAQITPDRGNANPFLPGASRTTTRRYYSIWIRFRARSGDRHGNTLFAGSSGLGALTYRVYAPDKGQTAQGGVPLPAIDKVIVYADGRKPMRITVPPCAHATPIRATAVARRFALALARWPAFVWHHAEPESASSSQGADAGYGALVTRLDRYAGFVVVRFRAPSFVATYDGLPLSGHEQVRYWSMCAYDLGVGRLAGCVADDQAHRDTRGYVTIVLGDPSRRPPNARALRSANWLPFGWDRQGVLVYRQVLAAASFKQSIERAPSGDAAMRSRMGAYYPAIVRCSVAQWVADRCGGG